MTEVYLCGGKFEKFESSDIEEIARLTKENSEELFQMPIEAIVELFDKLSKSFITNPDLREIDGANYLSLWLKRKNLTDIISLNLSNSKYLNEFTELKDNQFMKAQPRGLVCHWIAGNVPTLGIFSLVQSILCKNANLVKVPRPAVETMLIVLKELDKVEAECDGKIYKGSVIVNATSVIYISRYDTEANRQLSLCADAKVFWGGKQAIEAIKALPTQEHCEDMIFGPKYSFGIFDREFLEAAEVEKNLRNAMTDIIIFDQSACSSPQVLFFEKNKKLQLKKIAEMLAKEFEEASKKFPKGDMEAYTTARIINARGEYLLDENKDVVSSKGADWTILVNNEISLEEPIQSRTIFVKEIDDLSQIVPLITRKIQTVGIAIKDVERTKDFCDKITQRGAARCIRFGSMNHYESPWDGMLVLSRLCRFVTIKR